MKRITIDLDKTLGILVILWTLLGLIYIVNLFREGEFSEKNAESNIIIERLNHSLNLTENEEAVGYIIENIKDDEYYLQLFIDDYKYVMKEGVDLKLNYGEICWNVTTNNISEEFCRSGRYSSKEKWIEIYPVVLGDNSAEIIFVFLHEVGHLIQYKHMDIQEDEKWDRIHLNSTEFYRDYSRDNSNEDFADSYALYRLKKYVPKEKLEFIKRVEERGK